MLFSEGHVPEVDRLAVVRFIEAHRQDWGASRGHIFDDAQLGELAHLSAYNLAILQQALRLAAFVREGTELGLEEAMRTAGYQALLSEFVGRLTDRMAEAPGENPQPLAAGATDDLMGEGPRRPRAP